MSTAIILFLLLKLFLCSPCFPPVRFGICYRPALSVAVQPNKEFTVFAKWLPVLAVLGVLCVSPAHADEPLEDAAEALENLGDLVKSVDNIGHSFGRVVQPRQYGFRWNGGDADRGFDRPRTPDQSRSRNDRGDDDRDDD